MNCFQLVRMVLDEAYGEIPGSEAQRDAAIKAGLKEMQTRFRNLLRNEGPDYSDPVVRFGYVYKYVTCHANLVFRRIASEPILQEVFDRPDVTLTCLGGGPGSDLLGVIKYLQHHGKRPLVTCNICDREPQWMDTWQDVGKKVGTDLRIFTNYLQHDACVPNSWITKKYLQADLVTMVYFISELYTRKDCIAGYFKHVFERLKPGALVLFIDNDDSRFYELFEGLYASTRLTLLAGGEPAMKMPFDEQTEDLGDYARKFRNHAKLTANIAYRVLRQS